MSEVDKKAVDKSNKTRADLLRLLNRLMRSAPDNTV